MNRATKLYAETVVAVGLVVTLWYSVFHWVCEDPIRLAALLTLSAIAAALKFQLPGLTGTFAASCLFMLVAIAELSPAEVVVTALVIGAVQSTWKQKKRPMVIQVLFNMAAIAISAIVSKTLTHAVVGPTSDRNLLVLLPLAATILFVLNTLIISGVLALIENRGIFAIWRQWHVNSLPYYLGAALVAALMISSALTLSWRLSLVFLPLAYLIHGHFMAHVRNSATFLGPSDREK